GTHHPTGTVVGGVEPGSRAALAGFRPGDRVLSVDGDEVHAVTELVEALNPAACPASVTVARGADTRTLEVTPELGADGRARIGLRQLYTYERLPVGRALWQAVLHTGVVIPKILTEAGAVLAPPWGDVG